MKDLINEIRNLKRENPLKNRSWLARQLLVSGYSSIQVERVLDEFFDVYYWLSW